MTDPNPLGDDPEVTAMLRRMRFERDQEMAELEDETERLEAKQSGLPRVALKAMMAGELWSVSFGERTFDGHVVHVGDDFVGLTDAAGNLLDIVYRAIDFISENQGNPPIGRAPTTLRPATFRGRLLALQEGRPLEVGGSTGSWSLTGTIESVNGDHLTLSATTGRSALAPLSSIGFTIRRPISTQRR
jgi:hypothetical protein